LALDRLLTRRPEWRDSVRMVQVVVPSRTAVEDYRVFQRHVHELSEFAGSADELREAVIVNPYDLDVVADAMERALAMSDSERKLRMRALRRHVTITWDRC
jgi:trehalose-6-phosphate synthase